LITLQNKTSHIRQCFIYQGFIHWGFVGVSASVLPSSHLSSSSSSRCGVARTSLCTSPSPLSVVFSLVALVSRTKRFFPTFLGTLATSACRDPLHSFEGKKRGLCSCGVVKGFLRRRKQHTGVVVGAAAAMSRVYVGNLDPRATERELEDEFRGYGVLRR